MFSTPLSTFVALGTRQAFLDLAPRHHDHSHHHHGHRLLRRNERHDLPAPQGKGNAAHYILYLTNQAVAVRSSEWWPTASEAPDDAICLSPTSFLPPTSTLTPTKPSLAGLPWIMIAIRSLGAYGPHWKGRTRLPACEPAAVWSGHVRIKAGGNVWQEAV